MDDQIREEENRGIVKISDEVVEVIAGIAASEIKGVVGMSAGIVNGISQILSGKKNLSKGVKVNVGEDDASIDLYIVVEYGVKIPDLALMVQENVIKAVESMTGLKVSGVNVYIQNISLNKEEPVLAPVAEEE